MYLLFSFTSEHHWKCQCDQAQTNADYGSDPAQGREVQEGLVGAGGGVQGGRGASDIMKTFT